MYILVAQPKGSGSSLGLAGYETLATFDAEDHAVDFMGGCRVDLYYRRKSSADPDHVKGSLLFGWENQHIVHVPGVSNLPGIPHDPAPPRRKSGSDRAEYRQRWDARHP